MSEKQNIIFLTIFEGVEAKNLLRTSVVSTLLSDKNVRIVLFTKSSEKADYYRKQFPDPRLIFEVAPKIVVTGLDKYFSKLKFTLLKTATTDLKRRLRYEREGGYLRYLGGIIASRVLAHRLICRFVRFLDYFLVKNSTYSVYFEKYKPSLVFLAHLFDEPEIHLLREAKKRGVMTVGLVNSWDKVTARSIFRLLPDKAIVFNDIVKRELVKYDDMKEGDIFVSGLPQYDLYFSKKPSSREDFFKSIGVSPDKKLILYAPMGRAFGGYDFEIIDLLLRLIQKGECGEGVELFVRFQPNDFFDEAELQKRPTLKYDYPGKRFGSVRGVDWDMDENDLNRLVDTLKYSSVLVSYASSIVIDASLFGVPAVNINFELKKDDSAAGPTIYYKTEHYKNVLKTGGVLLAKDEEDLARLIREAILNPGGHLVEREELVRSQCHFTDGKSGERVANFILSFLK